MLQLPIHPRHPPTFCSFEPGTGLVNRPSPVALQLVHRSLRQDLGGGATPHTVAVAVAAAALAALLLLPNGPDGNPYPSPADKSIVLPVSPPPFHLPATGASCPRGQRPHRSNRHVTSRLSHSPPPPPPFWLDVSAARSSSRSIDPPPRHR